MSATERIERIELLTKGVAMLKDAKMPERVRAMLIDAALKLRHEHAKALEAVNG